MDTLFKTAKEQKQAQVDRIIQLRLELNRHAITEEKLNKINCADRAIMLEHLEAEHQFKTDLNER